MNTASWVQRFAPRPESVARLVCFHHAGASAAVFRPWALQMPEFVEVCAIQLPGHGPRLAEAPLEDIGQIAERVVAALSPLIDRPMFLFGHSMGATLAWETAMTLVDTGRHSPSHLFVSGRRPPHMDDGRSALSHLDEPTFISEIGRRYAPIAKEVLAEPEVLTLLLPALRSDIKALEAHRPAQRTSPLPVPITAMGGASDASAPPDHLDAWRLLTSSHFQRRIYPGGHFYLDERRSTVLQDVSITIRHAVGTGEFAK